MEISHTHFIKTIAIIIFLGLSNIPIAHAEKPEPPTIKVVEGGESHLSAEKCRKMIVGPGVNQPEAFPGYAGFVGWECPTRLRDGTMLVAFNAGYWHASLPTPFDPEWKDGPKWRSIGMPDVDAPTGGRAMIAKSTDNGVTWSKPETLLDSPFDDRHAAITELSDGTLLCSLFTYPNGNATSVENDPGKAPFMGVVRSTDGGKTWEQEIRRMPLGFTMSATDGPPLELPDGSILLAGEAKEKSGKMVSVVYRSTDRGATWNFLSKVATDYNQHEPSMARLGDGTLVMISRPEGDIVWSSDDGKTWTDPVTFGIRMYAPTLLVLADGTLLCHYGSYNHGGLRAIFSTDGGHSWVASAKNRGFLVDKTYGYSRSCMMPDGSAYLAYIGTGGHVTKQAKNNMIWSIRLRVRDDHSGIELIPIVPDSSGKTPGKMLDPGKPIPGV
jgi:photosystem II stability/assembly factor-like uncharacterized protein